MKRRFAVFDIDGTLYRYALHHALIDEIERLGYIEHEQLLKIQNARTQWSHRDNSESFWDFVEIQNEIFNDLLPNLDPKDIKMIAKKVAHKEKDRVYHYTRDLLKQMNNEKRVIIAISGSSEDVIKPFTDYWKFDHVIAKQLIIKNGKYTGENITTHTNKDEILMNLVTKHNLDMNDSIAIGDSRGDISLLKLVENPIAFNPEQDLLREAKSQGWPVVIERKNVIYELDPKNGKYILA